jgi:4-aminobutyrate aminotransferase-like enzyme
MHEKFGLDGRVHFNVGGAQAIEDSLKIVRNARGGKSLMFAFEGGYHGRTLGASSITSSYRYRRRYGHFGERAMFIPFPYPFRRPKGMTPDEIPTTACGSSSACSKANTTACGIPRSARPSTPRSTSSRSRAPAATSSRRATSSPASSVLDKYGILMVVDEIQMGFWRTGKLWSIEHFGVTPDVLVFGKALTNGLNPLSGLWAREELINPTVFPPGSTHSTFNSNPLGTRLGLEVLKLGRNGLRAHRAGEGRVLPRRPAWPAEASPGNRRRRRPGPGLRAEICQTDGFTRTRNCWTAWSTSASPVTCCTTASAWASCSTWVAGTRT